MNAITQYLKTLGYSGVSDSYYSYIDTMLSWYRGKVASFHRYRQYNGKKRINRERASLGMAKTVCEDWAALALNEKVDIIIDDERTQEAVSDVLDKNNFRVRGNQLVELTFALGTGAFVEFWDGDEVRIDYISAPMIYPLMWENGKITECAFGSERVDGQERYVYLNAHVRDERGQYVIQNAMFRRDGDALTPVDLPDGVEAEVHTGSDIPLFQIIKPNIINNEDLTCPMGISVYANAIDTLMGIDLVYDSYLNEFRLGKKRVVVPLSMARRMLEDDGVSAPVFDDNDVEFFALDLGGDAEPKLTEINMELRAEAHETGLQRQLNLLSFKCGLGNDRYAFEAGAAKTATEVVSEKSELYQNLKKHELVLEDALVDMVRAIAHLSGLSTDFAVSVRFDDSVIEDTAQEKATFISEINAGIRQAWEYRVKFLGEDEETARANVPAASTGITFPTWE